MASPRVLSASVAIAAVALSGMAACGGDDSSGSGSGASGSATTTGVGGATGAGGSQGGAGGTSPLCPEVEPTAGASCADEGLACSYGAEVLADCRKLFGCTSGKWVNTTPDPPPMKCMGVGCPMMPPTDGGVCDEAFLGSGCGYPDGTACTCMNCIDQGGGPCMMLDTPEWICPPVPGNPGCPPIAPNQGTACETPDVECLYYGNCGLSATCVGGAWNWEAAPCAE